MKKIKKESIVMPQQIKISKWVELLDGRKMFIDDTDLLGQKSPVGHFAIHVVSKQGDTDGEWVGTDKIKRIVGKSPYNYPSPVDLGVSSWSNTTKQMNEVKSLSKIILEVASAFDPKVAEILEALASGKPISKFKVENLKDALTVAEPGWKLKIEKELKNKNSLLEWLDRYETEAIVNFIKQARAMKWDPKRIIASLEKHGLEPEEIQDLLKQTPVKEAAKKKTYGDSEESSLISDLKIVWNQIAPDYFSSLAKKSIRGNDVSDAVYDYAGGMLDGKSAELWKKMDHNAKNAILAKAFPNSQTYTNESLSLNKIIRESIDHNCYTCTHWKNIPFDSLDNFIQQANNSCSIKQQVLEKHSISKFKNWVSHPLQHNLCSFWKNKIDEASKSIEKDIEKDDVDKAQLKRGIEIEYEHTDDWKLAEKIALDHLAEIPDYYTRLDNMEKQADAEGKKNESLSILFESIRCPVCGEQANNVNNRGSHKGFKGAAYTMKVYEHGNKECVYQTAYYPDYFGKGPKTIVHKWTEKKAGAPQTSQPTDSHGKCEKCGGEMVKRKSQYGEFLGCKNYPKCKNARKITESLSLKKIVESLKWTDHKGNNYSIEASDLGQKTDRNICPNCDKPFSKSDLVQTIFQNKGTEDEEIGGWKFKHSCGAVLIVWND